MGKQKKKNCTVPEFMRKHRVPRPPVSVHNISAKHEFSVPHQEELRPWFGYYFNLPFCLRLPEPFIIDLPAGNRSPLETIRLDLRHRKGQRNYEDHHGEFHYTKVTAYALLPVGTELEGIDRFQYMSDIFNALNTLIEAYRLTFQDFKPYPVAWRDMPMVMPSNSSISPDMGVVTVNTQYHDHFWEFPDAPKPDLAPLVNAVSQLCTDSNPHNFYTRMMGNAGHYLATYQFRMAIMESQTAFEAFVETMLYLAEMHIRERTDMEIENLLKTGFKNQLQNHLANRLNADLRFDGNGPVADWVRTAYSLRHRVAHEGYAPTEVEARQACQATEDLFKHILKLSADKGFVTSG